MADSKLYDLSEVQKSVGQLLNECRKSNKLTDVELDVGGKLFPAHRAVLSLYSPVLEAAVSDQWSTTRICPISDEYVDAEIMEDLLNFFYTGKINLTPENTYSVCVAAHFLQIPALLDISVQHLCQLITFKNVLTLFEFSINCQLEQLHAPCLSIIRENHETLLHEQRILQFPARTFRVLIAELKNFSDGPILRKNMFHCIIRWVENNLSERLNDLPFLLKNIPLDELPHKFFEQTVSKHELVIRNTSCAPLFENYLSAEKALKSFIIIGGRKPWNQAQPSMTIYDSNGQVWRKLPDMNQPRAEFSATVINQQDIIVCGGYTNWTLSQTTNSVEMFDWDSQTWKELFRLPDRLGSVAPLMAIHDNHLYIAGGGISYNNRSKAVLCFSFETQQWKYVKPMNYARSYGNLIVHKNHIYAIGLGSDAIERYDPELDEWTVLKTTDGHLGSNATLHQGKIYVLVYLDFYMYDPETDSWTTLPEQKFYSNGTSLISLNGKLLAVGGLATSTTESESKSSSIYEFNLRTMEWIEIGSMEIVPDFNFLVVGDFS